MGTHLVILASFALLVTSCKLGSRQTNQHASKGVLQREILLDDSVLVPGLITNTRDLSYRAEDLRFRLRTGNSNDPKRPKMEATLRFIEHAMASNPQCLRLVVSVNTSRVALTPVDSLPATAQRREDYDIVIIGGELEAVTTAIALAKKGLSVCLLYAGPLGGLCSDEGANLRFFDGYWNTPRPQAQREVFREALGMLDFVSLPREVSQRLLTYLQQKYADTISLRETTAYEELWVDRRSNRIAAVVTPAGIGLGAKAFIDCDPESRVAEKASIPFQTLTPNLAYGLVFDVENVTKHQIIGMATSSRLSSAAIASFAGVDLGAAQLPPDAKASIQRLTKLARNTQVRDRSNYLLGFEMLAEGFNLYMQLLALTQDDDDLRFLNQARRTSGFNIAFNDGIANINGINYSFGFILLQHAHSIVEDERLQAFNRLEGPKLEEYLRFVADDPDLKVRLPKQFYVRKSTAVFSTLNPYTKADFHDRPLSTWGVSWMTYPNDFRNISPRNSREREQFNRLAWSSMPLYWRCRPDVCYTEIENLYLLNKCMLTPEYSGATRILQNFVTTGAELAELLGASVTVKRK